MSQPRSKKSLAPGASIWALLPVNPWVTTTAQPAVSGFAKYQADSSTSPFAMVTASGSGRPYSAKSASSSGGRNWPPISRSANSQLSAA